ncbi:hypothetical protein Dimus_001664, partial [Dionaea muscipula]
QVPSRYADCEESLELTVAERTRLKEVFATNLRKEELSKYFDLINAQTLETLKLAEVPHPRMDLSGLLKVVSECGGGHIVKSFQPLLDPSTEIAAGTSEVPVKKISRKKKPATSDAADVEHKAVPSEGTESNTQESEAVLKEGATKARPTRMRKPHIISPAVGDNLLDIEEVVEEEEDEEETLIARSRRVLPKTDFVRAQEADKEETESDEVIGKGESLKRRRQKQESRTGPRKRARKAKSSVQEDEEKEEVRFQIMNSSPSAEELDKEIDEILAEALHHPFISDSLMTLDALVQEQKEENPSDRTIGSDVATSTGDEEKKDGLEKKDGEDEDVGQRDGKGVVVAEEEVEAEEEEEDESDESDRPLAKKYHLGVLSRRRLTIPHSKMVTRYANVLMGSSSRGARRYLSPLPPSHEIALVMRNLAEKERLNNELTSEKKRLTELATAALQLKSDMVKVTKEKQSVEAENERLKAELEKERSKGKRSRECLVLLHNDLSDMSLKNERLHNTLDEISGKVIKVYAAWARHARVPYEYDSVWPFFTVLQVARHGRVSPDTVVLLAVSQASTLSW